jgi:hypothetical protein
MRQLGNSRPASAPTDGGPGRRAFEDLRRPSAISQSEVFADLTLALAGCLTVALLGSLAASLF